MTLFTTIRYSLIIALTLLLPISMLAQKNTNKLLVTKKAIKEIKLQSGIQDLALSTKNGQSWNMKVSIPDTIIEDIPLIIALHWAGGESTYQEYADCLAFPSLDTLCAIIVAPSDDGLHWSSPINEARVIDLVNKLKKYWQVDKHKVIVTGYSNGGIGTWQYVVNYSVV